MKKIYLSVFSLAIAIGANAQEGNSFMRSKHAHGVESIMTNPAILPSVKPTVTAGTRATVVWVDDFSSAGTWTVANTNTGGQTEEWSIVTDPASVPSAGLPAFLNPFTSVTAANGFALINSDANNSGDNQGTRIASTIRTATAIDLTGYPNVILEFAHACRWWQEERIVRVSGDNGASWTDFILTDFDGYEFGYGFVDQNTENPSVERINISAIAGGMSQVLIEFSYDDEDQWGWYWAVDDVKILDQPLDDVQNISSYIVGVTNEGIEYGYTPEVQLDTDWTIGSTVYNFGANDQTNVTLDAVFNGFTSSSSTALIESDSTRQVEATESALGMTAGTTYAGTYTVTSGADAVGGAEFGDNTGIREFAVTDFEYAMDGIGVYTNSILGSLGTDSFLDDNDAPASDAMFVAAQYMIKSTASVSAIKVMLANGSVVGGEMYGSIIDTADFLNDNPTPIVNTLPGTIAQFNLDAGYILLNFPAPYSLAPGAYYAAAELYSNANFADIRVLDDQTVEEPSTASMIYLPGAGLDQSFTNGTAFGVRLLMEGFVDDLGINDVSLDGISVYPNPSEGIVNISNDNNNDNIITVYDMLGKVVYSTTSNTKVSVDLSANGTGVYLVKVSNENGSVVERVVIK